jgi:hypothetical protein
MAGETDDHLLPSLDSAFTWIHLPTWGHSGTEAETEPPFRAS